MKERYPHLQLLAIDKFAKNLNSFSKVDTNVCYEILVYVVASVEDCHPESLGPNPGKKSIRSPFFTSLSNKGGKFVL